MMTQLPPPPPPMQGTPMGMPMSAVPPPTDQAPMGNMAMMQAMSGSPFDPHQISFDEVMMMLGGSSDPGALLTPGGSGAPSGGGMPQQGPADAGDPFDGGDNRAMAMDLLQRRAEERRRNSEQFQERARGQNSAIFGKR